MPFILRIVRRKHDFRWVFFASRSQRWFPSSKWKWFIDVYTAKWFEGCDADVAPARIVVGESQDQKQK